MPVIPLQTRTCLYIRTQRRIRKRNLRGFVNFSEYDILAHFGSASFEYDR